MITDSLVYSKFKLIFQGGFTMPNKNLFYFFSFQDEQSIKHKEKVANIALENGFEVTDNPDEASIIASIGGDGTFLQAVRKTGFRQDAIYVGIATDDNKYLYTDFHIDDTSQLKQAATSDTIEIRKYPVLKVKIDNEADYYCLNDFYIKSSIIKSMTMNILIDNDHFETFRGDGLLVATPSGSTGYNKSLGGALVDPLTHCIQISEIASINNNNYRTIGSPMVLDKSRTVTFKLEDVQNEYPIMGLDNEALSIQHTEQVSVTLSDLAIKTVKIKESSFWNKVKRNFLQ